MKKLASVIIIVICMVLLSAIAYSAKTIYVEETDLVKLNLSTYDADGDKLTYHFEEPLNDTGEWQTNYGDEGEYNITISVSDGENEVKDYVIIIVKHKNRAPEIENIDDITIKETDTVEIHPVVTDEENDPVTIEISSPIGDDGVWKTGYDDAGEYNITITAKDGINTAKKEFKLIVEDLNRVPEIELIPSDDYVEISETESMTFSVNAEDPDGDEIGYQWSVDGIETNNTEKSFEFTTDYDSAGEHIISVLVNDKEKQKNIEWTVNVLNSNRAPEIIYMPEDITVKEGETVKINFSASDPDNDKLKYKISEPIGNDKIWKTTNYDAGEYKINITISDGDLETTSSFKITVEDVNVAPIFNKINDITISEGETALINLTAKDPDGTDVFFEIEKAPKGATLKGKVFSYSPDYDVIKHSANNFITGAFYNSKEKDFTVKIAAESDGMKTIQKFKITVKDKNRAPVLGEMDKVLEMNEADKIIINPSYSDPDGDRVKISISDPIGNDGEWLSTYDSAGEYIIDVVASDGTLETTETIELTVNNVNRKPYFENKQNSFEINENKTVKIIPIVKDPDGGTIELSGENLPNSSTFINGVFEWTPDYDTVKDSKTFTIRFIADDNETTVVENFDIIVNNVNRAPKILNTSQDKEKIYVGDSITFVVDAVDLDGDDLTYDWHFRMLDSEKDGSALRRTFTVPGEKEITVTVSDGIEEAEHIFYAKIYEKKTKEIKQETKKINVKNTSTAISQEQPQQKPIIKTYIIEDDKPESREEKKDSGFTVVSI